MFEVRPFTVCWTDQEIESLRDSIGRYELPPAPNGSGWQFGCDERFLVELRDYWSHEFSFGSLLEKLNKFPQYLVEIEGLDIHFVHVRGEGPSRPLLISHGWPGAHIEFWKVIEPLAFPSRFGGRVEDAFDIVIPSLPGFGFSGKPDTPIGQIRTAQMFNTLMTDVLGYSSYSAQGGDWGSLVTAWLALDYPANLRGIHLNHFPFPPPLKVDSPEAAQWAERAALAASPFSAYAHLQMTKPQSLAWLAAGSPLGQAAWIAERFHDWSDLRKRPFSEVHELDELIAIITIYVLTGSFRTAAWYYAGKVMDDAARPEPRQRCEVPTACTSWLGEQYYTPPPRSVAGHYFNIVRWNEEPTGGHFAAMEEPKAFVDDIRSWARLVTW